MGIRPGLSGAPKVLLTLAIAADLAGCGGGHHLGGSGGSGGGGATGGTGGAGGGEPLAMFGSDFETAFCAPLVACAAFTDLATCVSFEHFAQGEEFLTIVASVGRGTVVYDPVAAAACIAAAPQDCSVTLADSAGVPESGGAWWTVQAIAPCTRVFTGTLPLGADCRPFDKECVDGAFCSTAASGTCTGSCTAIGAPTTLHAVGEDCGDSGLCALPGICQGTCVVPPDHLASCDPSTQWPCRHLDDYCAVDAGGTTPTCLPRLAPGTPCALINVTGASLDPCVEEATCTSGVCVAGPVLGGPCDTRCRPPLACTNNMCAPSPPTHVCQ